MKAIIATAIMAVLMTGMVFAQCVDSDYGALSYTAGSATEGNTTFNDYCLENGNVMEFTCVDNATVSEEMPCMRGCGINWQGLGACKPTSGGRTASDAPLTFNSNGNSGNEDSFEQSEVAHMPEFSTVAAGMALIGSTAAYMLMRKRN